MQNRSINKILTNVENAVSEAVYVETGAPEKSLRPTFSDKVLEIRDAILDALLSVRNIPK